ncbi:MAG: lipoate--protein ligase family protein [Nanoarchaeota archaeon]|nr:lipoate--protein ligase family protein [Nanoarchaeota archaeon]
MKWRLIIDRTRDAYTNMAIDYALLKLNKVPTVRFYMWSPPAVSIGYFQSLAEEIDLDRCKKLGVDYVRRITGGGAVFHDAELTYSITINEDNEYISKGINESYQEICGAIIKGLSNLDIKADYVPLNDLIVNGKKISGCAQTRKEKTILQHGTLILDVDVEKMFSILLVPNEKIRDKMISSVKERVTSLKNELGRDIGFAELSQAFKKGFEEYFNIEFTEQGLTEEELGLAEEIRKDIFAKESWNRKR